LAKKKKICCDDIVELGGPCQRLALKASGPKVVLALNGEYKQEVRFRAPIGTERRTCGMTGTGWAHGAQGYNISFARSAIELIRA